MVGYDEDRESDASKFGRCSTLGEMSIRKAVQDHEASAKEGILMKCVYVAGRYSAPTVIEVLRNIRNGRRAATELLLKGHAVFVPWLDSELFLQLREGEDIKIETIQAHSMAWLARADVVYVLRGW